MAKREIIWTPTANRLLKETVTFWNRHNHSNTYSKRLLKSVNEIVRTISAFPVMGKSFNKEGVRVAFVLVHFSIFYRFGDKTIEVLLFWDNRQDPEKLRELMGEA